MSDTQQADPAPSNEQSVPAGRPGIGQLIVTAAAIAFTAAMLVILAFVDVPAANKDMFNIMLGAILGGWTTALTYHIGSSAGSASKDVTNSALARIITR